MIAKLKGQILEKNPTSLIIDVGGIGFLVSVPLTTSSLLDGKEVELFIETEVRQDSIQLFGFLRKEEKELFVILRQIHGIGPQTALAILSSMSIEEFFIAVREQNPKRFLKIPKVGKKTAERIVLELKEKDLPIGVESLKDKENSKVFEDVIYDAVSALETLGYKSSYSYKIVEEIKKSNPDLSLEEILKKALQKLSF
jgi:Holliday junction DNA helicase RuvA